jgi:hypothetical protein
MTVQAQTVVFDEQKQKQWQSMENGPWDFAPEWYYYFLHNGYSGAENTGGGAASRAATTSGSRRKTPT